MRANPTPPRLHGQAALVLLALGYLVFGARVADLQWHGPVTAADAAIVLTALSRVYLSAHSPSDVVAAAAEGLIWLALCLTTLDRWSASRRGCSDG